MKKLTKQTEIKARAALERVRQTLEDIMSYDVVYQCGYVHLRGNPETRYIWSIKPVILNGRRRYMSGILRYVRAQGAYHLTRKRYHVRRKDAKSRALTLCPLKR